MASGTVIPNIPPQFFTNAGDVAAGHKLFSYSAGTTTKINTYTDAGLTTPNTNPIVLDSAGRALIFLSPTSYKFVLAPPTDTDPPTSPLWTRDAVFSLAAFNVNLDIVGTAGESIAVTSVCYLSDGSFATTPGYWYEAKGNVAYGSMNARVLGYPTTALTSGESGAFRIAGRVTTLSGLSPSVQYYVHNTVAGALTATRPDGVSFFIKPVGVADTASSLILSAFTIDQLPITTIHPVGASTWVKHQDAQTVQVFAIGGGAGGGSGRKGLAATARVGGGGGGGGAVSLLTIQASQLTATVAVTVGAGGTGGAAQATNSTNGVNGTNGVASSFGAYLFADGGTLGGGGGSGAGGAGGNGGTFAFIGGPGSTGDVAGGAGVGGLGSVASNLGAGGGASGGGISVANAASAGGAGAAGARGSSTSSGGTSGAIGVAGGNGTAAPVNSAIGGGAGGGGGSSIAANGGAGGNGALYGGAGGGGGAAVDATGNSGKGGDGAAGLVIVTQY